MARVDIEQRRDMIAAQYGPWIAYNIRLAEGVYTMGTTSVGTPEFMIRAFIQAVSDLARKPLNQLRVLDLGCHEGGYAIEFGLHGATVVGIEGREANIEKARFAAETLGLSQVTFRHADVREIDEQTLGRFDVVLCLGILYHLEAPDAVRLLESCHQLCDDLTVVRSAVGLSPNTSANVNGREYWGRRYMENTHEKGASLENPVSVLPARACLLNVLSDVGFTSVAELRNPVVPLFEDLVDSISLIARRGVPIEYRSLPELNDVAPSLRRPHHRGPAWLRHAAHPQQGLYWRVREKIMKTTATTVFGRKPPPAWRDKQRL